MTIRETLSALGSSAGSALAAACRTGRSCARPARRIALPFLLVALAGCASVPGIGALTGKTGEVTITLDPEVLTVTLPAQMFGQPQNVVMSRIGSNGSVETWRSKNGLSISLDQGIIVATRGFGFDLMGSDAGPSLAALTDPSGGPHRRHMRYLSADNHSYWLQAGCEMGEPQQDGRTGLWRVDERCRANRASFTNSYWLDGSGEILRSRQWIAPELGYLELKFPR